jgi:hydrogenase-4 component E
MNSLIETNLILLILANLVILGSTKVQRSIKVFALESPLLGLLVLLAHYDDLNMQIISLIIVTVFVKSLLVPWLLFRAVSESSINRAVEPFVGYNASLLAGMLALFISLWLGSNLPLPTEVNSKLVIPVAFYMIFTGLFLIITRKKAINQVIGYLVLENGIYIFGTLLATHVPMLVELGILLDLLAGVFIMGITLFHINQSFDHIDISRLSDLKDWKL